MNERQARISRYIARRMREVRRQRKFTQVDIAREIGVSESVYNKWERVDAGPYPSCADLFIFCEATSTSILDIFPNFGGDW